MHKLYKKFLFLLASLSRVKICCFVFLTVFIFLSSFNLLWGQTTTVLFTSSSSWVCPPGVSTATVECWGGGGSGGGTTTTTLYGGGGGAGGAYAKKSVAVTSLTSYSVNVGATKTGTTSAGAQGNPSWFSAVGTVFAEGGAGGAAPNAGVSLGGIGSSAASIGDVKFAGGNGADGSGAGGISGGGGGGGGSTGVGGNAVGITAGPGTTTGGGAGGAGRNNSEGNGNTGNVYGGGGSGAFVPDGTDHTGGNGAAGLLIITYTTPSNITPFADLSFCTGAYPSAYQTVSFSLKERLMTDFNNSQAGATIILTLPTGFEFNTGAAHTVTKNGGGSDITALALTSVTTTSITVTLTTDAAGGNFDELFFNSFQIRATAAGSGDLLRTGTGTVGTFLINSTPFQPLSSESFGFMFANTASIYNVSDIGQYTTQSINRNCESSRNAVILRIRINISGGCPPPTITQFDFSTVGDVGFSQNPAVNIASAKLYYNEQLISSPLITDNIQPFGTVNNPNGAFTITGSQKLDLGSGDYYFYLVYDVPATANAGDRLDASMTSFVMDATTISDMVGPNPAGTRTIVSAACYTPDVPGPPANVEAIPRNSYVIPMDNTNQAVVAPFNLKAYGMVHALLMNDIPVKWVILSGKAKDAADFTANASRVLPTAVASAAVTFKASAFIIDSTWINRSYYGSGLTALQVISTYTAQGVGYNQVAVFKLAGDENLNVRYTLNHRPKIAIFTNGGYEAVQETYMAEAGLVAGTNYFTQNAGNFPGLVECYSFCSEAHWDFTTNEDINSVDNIVKFVNEGGNFLAQCAGIDLYENHQPSGGHFQTTRGISFDAGSVTMTYSNPDLAFNQFEGAVANENGTIERFWPSATSAFNAETYNGLSDPLPTTTVAATAVHLAPSDSVGGNVFYLSGHDYVGATINYFNGRRMYLNATLIPAGRPSAFVLDPGANTSICIGQSTTLGGSPTGGSGSTNYVWSPSAGLNNTTSANPVASPTITTVYTVIANDNGCPGGPNSVTVTVNPLPTIAPAATAANACVSAGAQSSTLTYGAVTNAPTNYTIDWNAAANTAGLVDLGSTALPASPITVPIAAGVAAGTYTGTLYVTNGNGCASTGNAFTLTINPLPTIAPAATAAAVCFSAGAQSSTLTYGATTGVPTNYTIDWNAAANAAGLVDVGSTALPASPITVPVAAGVVAGTYTGTLYVTNGNGCASLGNAFTLTINPLPTIAPAATAAAVCFNAGAQSSTLTYGAVTNAPTNYTIDWNAAANAAGLVDVGSTALPASPITVPIAAGVAAGTYTGTLFVTNGNGCASTGNAFTLTINPLPTIAPAATAAAVCFNAAVQSSTLAYGAVTNAPTNYTIDWNAAANAAGLVDVGSTALPASPITVPVAAGVAAGTYTGTLFVTNGNGCASTGNAFTLTINPLPTIAPAAAAAAVCFNADAQSSTLTYGAVTNAPTNYTIDWNAAANAAGLVDVGSTALPASPITVPVAAGVVAGTYTGTLFVTNGNGCASTGNAFTLTINPLPTIAPAATAAAVCFNAGAQSSTLTYGAVTNAPTNYTIDWNAAANAAGLVDVGSTALPASPITVPVAAGVAVGTYTGTLFVTNGNGCASTGNAFTLTINPLPTIAPAAAAASVCFSAGAQSSTLTYGAVTDAPTNYTIDWNAVANAAGLVDVGSTALPASPITVPVAAGVAAGTYTGTLYVTNGNGCASTGNAFTLTINPLPTIAPAATAAAVCFNAAAQSSTLAYGATTGVPTNYTIDWNAAANAAGLVDVGLTALPASPITVPVAAGVAAGTYTGTLFVTSATGCASLGNAFTLTINPLPTIAPAATAASVCFNAAAQSSTLTYGAVTNAPTNYTIDWNAAANAAGLVDVGSTALPASPITVPIAAGVGAGTYTGTLFVTNGNGCASTGNAFTLTINPLPTIAPAATAAAVCFNAGAQSSTLAYGATTGVPTNYTIDWNAAANAAGLVDVGSTALPVSPITVPVAAGVAAGTYTGTLFVTNGNGCASTGNAFTLTINPLPTIAPAATAAAVCFNAGAQSSTLTYGATTGAPTNYTIDWNAAANAAGLVDVGSTALPASPITVPVAAGVVAGTYTGTLYVTNGNGCASTGNAFTLTINPLPTIAPAATAAAVCFNAGAQSSTLTYGAVTNAPTNYTITWNAAALAAGLVNVGSTALPASPITVPIAAGVAAGTYTGTLFVTNGNGCASTGNAFTLTINPLPTIAPAATAAAVCFSAGAQSSTLTYGATTGAPTNYTIDWNAAANAAGLVDVGSTALPVSPITVPVAAGVAVGTYTGTLYVTNGNGCASTGNVFTLTINSLPTIAPAATAAAVCFNAAAQSSTLAYGATTGAPTNYTIDWNAAANAAGLVDVGSTALPASPITVPIAAGVAAGTYTGTLYVTNGCTSTGNAFTLTINPLPTIAPAAPAAAVCFNAAVQSSTLTYGAITGVPTNYTIDWNAAANAAGLVDVGSTALPVSPITVPIAAGVAGGTYTGTLFVTNGNGCASTGNVFTLTINPLPTIAPAATAANVCFNAAAQSSTLTYGATTGAPTDYTIDWNAAANAAGLVDVGSTALPASPITVPVAAGVAVGTYTGILFVTNGNGCASTGNAFTLTINPLPTIAPAATAAAVCFNAGAQSSTLAYGATTGVPTNYTIDWDAAANAAGLVDVGSTALPASPITVPVAAGVVAGTYTGTLFVTNGNGCASTGNAFTLTINPLPTIAPAATAAAVCFNAGAQSSTLTYGAVTNAPTNYTIDWNAAANAAGLVDVGSTALPASPITVPVAAGVVAGTYTGTLFVTNGNGCASTGNAFTLTITPTDDPSFSYSAGTYCQSGTTTPIITGGFPGTFSASPVALVFVSTSTGEVNLAASPANTYTITFTTSGPCPSSSSQVITITVSGVADFHYDGPFCKTSANPSPIFDGGGSAGVFGSVPAGISFVSTSTGEINLSASTAGTYTITNTITAAGCFTVTATNTVTIDPAATVNAGPDQTICAGFSTTLAGAFGGSASSSTWSGGAGGFVPGSSTPTAVYTPSAGEVAAGTVTLTLTTNDPANSCGAVSNDVIIKINPIPAAPTASGTAICEGFDATLTATAPGGTYEWYDAPVAGTLLQTGASYTTPILAATTTYYVQTTVLSCTGPRTAVTVSVNPTPAAPVAGSNSPLCIGNTLSLTASTVGGSTYAWTGPNLFSSPSQNPTLAGAGVADAGTYSVIATENGCVGPAGTAVVTVAPQPATPTAGSNSPVCVGNTLSLTASTIGGASYFWNGPSSFTSTSQNPAVAGFTTADAGTYSVTATVAGCTGSAGTTSVTINPPPPAPTTGSNGPICSGNTLSLTASTIAGASYNWTGPNSFSSTIQDPAIGSVSTLASGTYSVTATVPGCATSPTGTISVVINQTPAAPTPGSNSPACIGGDISLTASGTGTTYAWSGPNAFTSTAQNPVLTGVGAAEAGTYTVNTTSAAGCTGTDATTSVIVNPPPPAPTTGSDLTVCSGTTLSLTASTIPSATIYSWTGPNTFTSVSQNPTMGSVTTLAEGTYSVTAFVPGCALSPAGTVSVTVFQTPAAPTPGSNSPICAGIDLSLTASTVGGSTYSWTGPAGFTSTTQDPVIAAATPANAGIYSVVAIENGCTGSAGIVSVTINSLPAAPVAGNNSPLCEGTTLSLTASTIAGATYSWFGPNSFVSISQNPTIVGITLAAAGIYSVTASVSGCSGPAGTTSVVVNPIPATSTAGSNSPVCSGQMLSLTASTVAGATYSWSGPNSFTSTSQDPIISSVTTAATGLYAVTATALGCTSLAGTTSVTIDQTPSAPVAGNNGPICVGFDLSLTAGTLPGATYAWTGPNSFTDATQNPVITGVSTAEGGVYSVIATVNGCSGPAGTTTVIVNTPPTSPTAGSNSPVCTGQTLSLTANTFASATYTWNGPNGFSSTLQNPTIGAVTPAAVGDYSVFVTVTGCAGGAGTVSVTVNLTPTAPTATNNSPFCSGSDLSLTASTVGGSTYQWAGPSSFSSTTQDPVITGATTAQSGTYSVTAIENGCASLPGITTVTVNAFPAAPVAGNNGPLCIGDNLTLTANTISGATYSWNGPNGFSSASQNPTIAAVTTDEAGTYSVSVTVAGCLGAEGTTALIVAPPPAPPTPGSNTPVCSGTELSLTANTIVGATYTWSGPNSFTATTQNPTITPVTTAADGIYSVFVQIGSCLSAASTTSVTIFQTPVAPVAGGNSPACIGFDLSLTASTIGSSTYSWAGPNGFSSTVQNPVIINISSADAGTYTVFATENGCNGPVATTAVIINPPPAAPTTGSNSPLCSGQTLNLTSNTIASATYSWSGPNSFVSVSQNPTIAGATTAASGTYSITATVPGCPTSPEGTVSITVNQTPAAPVASNNTPLCSGNDVSLTASTIGGSTYSWTGPNSFSSTLQDPVILAATTAASGIYSVIATENGCTGPAGTTSVTVNPIPVAPAAGNNSPLCIGDNLNLTANTIPGATYSWNGPNGFTSALQNPTIAGASTADAGTYSVSVTVAGCPGPEGTTSVIVAPPPAAPTPGSNTPVCSGSELSLTASTIVGATYNWSGPNSFSASTQNPTITSVTTAGDGIYSVFVQIGSCVSPAGTTSVTINPLPVAPTAGSNSPLCIGDNLSLTASTIAGTTYVWSGPNSFSSTLQNPAINSVTTAETGTYSVSVTSIANGCVSPTSTQTVSVTIPAVVNAGTDQTMCSNNPAQLSGTITGGTGTVIWSTLNGVGIFSGIATLNATYTPNINDTLAGNILLIISSTNNGGCPVATDTMVVFVTPGPVANAGADQSICSNNYSTVNVSGTVQFATGGVWSSSGTGTFQSPNTVLTNTYVTTPLDSANGSVILILTSTGNGSCAAVNDAMLVTFTPAPAVNAGTDIPVCFGNVSAQLNGSVSGGATTGVWTTLGTGTFIPTASTLNATYILSSADTAAGGTTLVLTSTNFGNCIAVTDTVVITMTPAPVVAAGSDITVCANKDSVSLNGSITVGSTTGYWSTSGTGIFAAPDSSAMNATYIPSAADTAAGSIQLFLTSTNGCRVVKDSLIVTITNAPTVNAGADVTVCGGTTVALNGTINSAAAGGQWTSSGNGTFTPNNSTLNATYVSGSNDTSLVTLTLTTTGNGQCLAVKDSMTITIGRKPVAGFSVPQICVGQSITFTDTSSILSLNDTITSWNWTIAGGTYTVQNTSHTYTVSGKDTVVLIVTSVSGCSDTAMQVVNINPTPVASFTVLTSCSLDSVYFGSTSTISSGNIVSWIWNFGDTNTSTQQKPVHYYDSTGVYIVSLTVTSDSGCTSTFIDTITPSKGAVAGFSFTADCDFNAVFTDTSIIASGDSIISWSWNFGDASALNTTQNPSHTYVNTGTFIVTLKIVTLGGCNDSITDTLIFTPAPIADFSPQSGTYSAGATVAFTDLSTNAITWLWNFDDGKTDTIQHPTHTFDLNGTLNVMLIVTNTNGCPDTAQYTFIFNTNVVAVPSAFTPNGDGFNDVLYVKGGPLKEMDWRIYNEWGNEVFHSTAQSDGWDGTYKGKKQVEGRFVFILKGITYGDTAIELSGDVTILR
ncbi:MAG: PKD domain-containing protein [Bacteroidetes bacterium]|nr:MAG: PKD domain-containing protein [Bacteroidota bacterium]